MAVRRNNVNAVLVVVSLILAVYGTIAFQSTTNSRQQQSTAHRHVAFSRQGSWGSCPSRYSSALAAAAAGSATIEKEALRTAGPAVLDRPATDSNDDIVKERVREGGEGWEVRIYNDGMNTREHVARSLVQITGMTEMSAYQTMMQAHQNGIASVGRFAFEIAEMYNEGLRKQGIISDIVPADES
jgi:ATP-dependent Clp protease adapter protein ClpS